MVKARQIFEMDRAIRDYFQDNSATWYEVAQAISKAQKEKLK